MHASCSHWRKAKTGTDFFLFFSFFIFFFFSSSSGNEEMNERASMLSSNGSFHPEIKDK